MKQFLATVKDFIIQHKKAIIITASSVLGAAAIAGIIVLIVINSGVKIVYQPVKACDLLTLSEAKTLLGEKAFSGNDTAPVIKENNAASTCSYSDLNEEQDKVVVIAVSVRSGLNDEGVFDNKQNFIFNKPTSGIQEVPDIGDAAYFNLASGQLNILSGKRWIILSYGVGSTPQANTVDDAVKLAKLILN